MLQRNLISGLWRIGLPLLSLGLALLTSGSANAADLTLFDGKSVAGVVYDSSGGMPIAKVSALLSHDLTALTGHAPKVTEGFAGQSGPAVVIGLWNAPLIQNLLKADAIDPTPIAGKWESYGRAVVPAPWNPAAKVLVIFGSDTRGTIYGVVDLTREMGVSAWEWWADVTIRKVDRIAVDALLSYSKEPTVKYRAIFLNDEDFGLKPWAAKTYEPEAGTVGPKTYARIFELMWRLKANTIWPAMHKGTVAFDEEPGNAEMAASYAIIHATSHAEPMLRNNDREWDPSKRGAFNWQTNRQALIDYWDEAVDSHKQFENIYTIGLRGVGDVPMQGAASPQQTRDILEDVMAQQRAILEHRLGRHADTIPQAFTPYKEVLPAYDTGLKVPDDVMLTWPDDNYGYIRRLSDARERARSGGAGVYYHISYWGPPMSYLWLATAHPALLWEEMNKAYRFDTRKIWVLNVGDLKPGEYLTQLFLDMAFDNAAFGDISSVRAHLKSWAAANFGAAHADEITDLLWRYYDLAFDRKPEFMGWNETYPTTAVRQTAFNIFAFDDENQRRLDAYKDIEARADALMRDLPADRRDAFYQLVDYPVDAAAEINARVLDMDKSITYGLERRASADLYSAHAKAAEDALVAQENVYNNLMAGGKWRYMMDIAPHKLPLYATPAFPSWTGPPDKGCAVQTEDGAFYEGGGSAPDLPAFHRELPQSRYIDLFVKSKIKTAWTAVPDSPWIKLSVSSGTLSPAVPEQRILATVDWAQAPDGASGKIAITCASAPPVMPVGVHVAPANTVKDVSFLENDRVVSIYATHADALSDGWETLTGLGHTGASLRSKLDLVSAKDDSPSGDFPTATYRFATTTTDDKATLDVIALPTAPITSENGLRVAVSIDGGAPVVLDLKAAEFSQEWRHNVLTNEAIGRIGNLRLAAGAHELKVTALDPGLILDRFEIAFTGAQQAYGPVPETRIAK
jgi:hypothetical protein